MVFLLLFEKGGAEITPLGLLLNGEVGSQVKTQSFPR
jgi:hypothetical protein